MRNAGLCEAQAGIKIAGRNINNLRYADDTIFMAEREASFNFMAAVTICSDFGYMSVTVPTVSPSVCHEVMGLDAMILVF